MSELGAARCSSRQVTALVIVLIAVGYGMLALVLPHPYPTFDEAKYLAIGRNALDGLGPLTAFGDRFLPHAPFWPMLLAAPDAALHLDPWAWGYLLNAVSGAAVLLLTAHHAWRFGPAAAFLATVVLAGWLGMFALTRTARLDVPVAALTFTYLTVAASAIQTGLLRRGVLAGVLFAWAFLTKESALILLGAPFIAALALRRPIGNIAAAAGTVLLAAIPLVAWWYGWYADATGRVFALGLPGVMLGPLAMLLLVIGGSLVVGGRSARSSTIRARVDAFLAPRQRALLVGAAALLLWTVVFGIAFSRADVQAGRTLLDLGQVARWLKTWASDLAPVALISIGAIPAIRAMLRSDDRPIDAVVGVLAAAPWLLLVAVLGEPPRNDIAVLALLTTVGSWGWLLLVAGARDHPRPRLALAILASACVFVATDSIMERAGVVASGTPPSLAIAAIAGILAGVAAALGLRSRRATTDGPDGSAPSRWMAATDGRVMAILLITILSLGALGTGSANVIVVGGGGERSAIASDVASWLEADLPDRATVLFGSVLANETALELDGHLRLRHLQATIGVTDPNAPLGISVGGRPAPDVVVMDPHPRQHGFLVFTASLIERDLAEAPSAIVYVTGIDTATPSMVDWLATTPGITLATTITAPPGQTPLVARIYRVDRTALRIPSDRVYASAAAIDLLLHDLAGTPVRPRIASDLLRRVAMTDPGSAADAVLARLRAAAGP